MKGIKKYIVVFFVLFVFLLTASPTWALSLKGRVEEHTLKNGMKILMLKRHYSPTVSFFMSFKVGSAEEYSGISGTAHLLEHMLFKGTKVLGTRDYIKEKKVLDEIDRVAVRLDNEILKGKKADEAKINKLKAELARLQKRHKRYVVKDEIDSIYSKTGGLV